MFFFICSIFALASIFIYASTKRMSIALLFSLEWTMLSILVCVLDLPRDEYAFLFILVNVVFFSIPSLFQRDTGSMSYRKARIRKIEKMNDSLLKIEGKFVKVDKYIILLNLLALIYLGYFLGFSIFSFQSEEALMLKMNSISSSRYSGDDYTLPLVNRLVNTLVYAACGIEGFFMCCKKNKLFYLNLLLLFVQTLFTNTKATIVFGFAFWLAGYITGLKFYERKVNTKKALLAVLAVVGVFFFTVIINYLRRGGAFTIQDEIRNIATASLIAPYSAFSLWYSSDPQPSMEFGMNTFSCVFSWLGIREHVNGDFVYSSSLVTNVYTIFKHLINDFSYIGAILFITISGIMSAVIDNLLLRKWVGSVGFSIVLISMILTAFFSSIFRYSTNLIACVIIILFSLFTNIKVIK